MKRFGIVVWLIGILAWIPPAWGLNVMLHGDFNNRFQLYTNQNGFFRSEQRGIIRDDAVEDAFGEIKYRLWAEMATHDGRVKGVYAIELGGLRFGEQPVGTANGAGKSAGGRFSGDGVNIESRWAYTDFQWPWTDRKNRFRLGLQPFTVNHYLWQETVLGVLFYGSAETIDYQLAWMRPIETNALTDTNDAEDTDAFLARGTWKPMDDLSVGLFVLHMRNDNIDAPGTTGTITSIGYEIKAFANAVRLNVVAVGLDGAYARPVGQGKFFLKWDVIYEGGEIKDAAFAPSAPGVGGRAGPEDFNVSAWFAHADIGYILDRTTLTYIFWFASGDDDPNDDTFNGFLSVDVEARTTTSCSNRSPMTTSSPSASICSTRGSS